MTALTLVVVFIGNLHVTSYRSVKAQTDDSPNWTSIGEHCNVNGVAVSRDLLDRWGGPLHYGDELYIDGVGWRKVNDVMNARHKASIDCWVPTFEDERVFAKKWNNKRTNTWVVRKK